MADVFISYSRRNLDLVRRLASALQSRDKDVFVDIAELWRGAREAAVASQAMPASGSAAGVGTAAVAGAGGERAGAELHGIPPSSRWMEEIKAGIAGADAVVVVLTPAFAASSVGRAEIAHALSLNKRIVPVLAEPTEPDSLLPELAALHWLPLDPGAGFDADVERLVRTLETDVERVHLHTRLLLRADEWNSKGEERSLLLRGRELAEAEAWMAASGSRQPAPLPLQGELVLASRRAATRRQRGSITTALVIAAAMVVLAVFALLQRSQAVHQRSVALAQRAIALHQSQISLSGELAAESVSAAGSDVAIQSLLALAADRRSPTALARSALVGAAEQPLEWIGHLGYEVNAVAYAPSGREIAVGTQHGVVLLAAQGRVIRRLDPGRQVNGLAYKPGGGLLAVADSPSPSGSGSAGSLRLYRTGNGAQAGAPVSFASAATSVAFSSDGSQLAVTTDGGEVYLDTASGGVSTTTVASDAVLLHAAFSPSGAVLAVCGTLEPGSNGTYPLIEEYRTGPGARLRAPSASFTSGVPDAVDSLAFSPSGGTLYAVDGVGSLDSFDPAGLRRLQSVTLASRGESLAVSRSGAVVATGDSQGAVQLWDSATGQEIGQPMHDGSNVYGLAFSPAGGALASGDLDGGVVVWRADGLPPSATAKSAPGEVLSLSVDSNATTLADVLHLTSGGLAGSDIVDLWPLGGRGRVSELNEKYSLTAAVFAPRNPELMALGDNGGNVYSYDLSRGSTRRLFHDAGRIVEVLAFSADGSRLAVGDDAGHVVVLDASDGALVRRCPELSGSGGVEDLAFAPGGGSLATATEFGGVRVCSLRRLQASPSFVNVDESPASLAYTPDGATLLEGDQSGDVEEFATSSLAPKGVLHGDGAAIDALAVSPGGTTLATVDAAGALHLWDLAASEQLGPGVTLGSSVLAAGFSPAGSLLATGDAAGQVVLWPSTLWGTSLPAFERDLCSHVGGNLTQLQWHQYVPGERYQKVCPTR